MQPWIPFLFLALPQTGVLWEAQRDTAAHINGTPIGNQRMKILTVFGTRPEAIKMAPVAAALQEAGDARLVICLSGQHREMLAGVLELFGLSPDHDLRIMKPEQDLAYLTGAVMSGLQPVLAAERPDWVLVHGDTTTAMAAALAAFYAGCRVAHVEAGLRSGDLQQPWPEEMNRSVADRLSNLLFAPTEGARENLLRENISAERIVVTGNTVVDALLTVCGKLESDPDLRRAAAERVAFLDPGKRLILVTGHRRENLGQAFERICRALRRLADQPDIEIVYPVHLNPRVQEPVRRILEGVPNVHLIEPLDYLPFVYLMKRSDIILTDSGGIQEEAPSLGKPVLVMRDVTERPEALRGGSAALVGTDEHRIVESVTALLDSPVRYAAMARAHHPYGDGRASIRIRDALLRFNDLLRF
jgi:UDP-N-acetylglucosamine 2-epimerase (non-hydrolysing)